MSEKCNGCPMLKSEVQHVQTPLEEASRSLSEGAMDSETTMGGVIRIERENGTVFSYDGEIDGPTAVRILDEIDKQKGMIEKRIRSDLSCGEGPITLRSAGVKVTLCRRFTDKVPEGDRVSLDPHELYPVFIRSAQSLPPRNS